MSDTPRTDAALIHNADLSDEGHGYSNMVPAEFARELERENAKLREDKARLDWMESHATGWADHDGRVPGGAMRGIEYDYFAEETLREAIDKDSKSDPRPSR